MKWLALLLLASCAQVTSLNLRKHQFGLLPTKVIWFQVAGLEEEQIALLRFNQPGEQRTSFENNICVGKTWAYNLYDVRPSAQATFLSQITGKKNIKNTCEDANLRPIWNYLAGNGYVTGIFEAGATKEQSITSFNQCGEKGLLFLSSLYLWLRQEPVKGAQTFHYDQEVPALQNQLVYDRTCSGKSCGSSITEDVKAIYNRFSKTSHKHFLIVRDFSYLAALQAKDYQRAKEILSDLERAYGFATDLAESYDYLVLLTSGDSKFIELPEQGKNWFDSEKTNSNLNLKKSKLTNLVLATGARAENFCGMYESAQVFERILSGPKQQGLELKIINPFK